MYNLLSEDNIHSDYRRRGLERVNPFSWHKSAKRTLDCYRDVAAR
jgi:hypothetical protein